jgi:hypothetical protein
VAGCGSLRLVLEATGWSVIEKGESMKVTECYKCGVTFGMPDEYYQNRRNDHAIFYCPNGHSQYFSNESEAEKYKRLYDQAAANSLGTREKLATLEREKQRLEAKFNQHKKRAAAGVCPCCNRTVAQLAKHMQSKHKGFVALQGVTVQKQLTDGTKPN